MAQHKAKIEWKCTTPDFRLGKYTREHTWAFDGGVTVPASAAPAVVPAPYSNPANVDPEEAFVASLSSCHMLTFLYVAQKAGFVIDSYEDQAIGYMTKNERGKLFVSRVALRPRIVFSGAKQPTAGELDELHHHAHEECYIANSVLAEVVVEAPLQG